MGPGDGEPTGSICCALSYETRRFMEAGEKGFLVAAPGLHGEMKNGDDGFSEQIKLTLEVFL